MHETSLGDEQTSTETVVDWYHYCREVCAERMMKHHAEAIGGPGTTVKIGESKFGNMKYHRGRYVEGQWVFGGICRETKACLLSCPLYALTYCRGHASDERHVESLRLPTRRGLQSS